MPRKKQFSIGKKWSGEEKKRKEGNVLVKQGGGFGTWDVQRDILKKQQRCQRRFECALCAFKKVWFLEYYFVKLG